MFNSNFNQNFQGMGNNPYAQNNQMEGYGPYTNEMMYNPQTPGGDASMSMMQGNPMGGYVTADQMYPDENQQNNNDLTNYAGATAPSYARGGRVKRQTRKMPSVGEMMKQADILRQHGERRDTVLAHINPEEAEFLAQNFGGDINPHTGLPQFGLFSNPGKWFKSIAGGTGGAILGNMLLPGVGGIIGGALGGAAGSAVRGRKDYGQAALRGAGIGAMLPSAASLAGYGANAMGATGVGSTLSNYGNTNAILPSIGRLTGATSGIFAPAGMAAASSIGNNGMPHVVASGQEPYMVQQGIGNYGSQEKSWGEKLLEPSTLLAGASVVGQYMAREKPKTAKQLARDAKEYQFESMLTADERKRKEEHDLEAERSRRRIRLNSYLPEERLGNIGMIRERVLTPEEAARMGRPVDYYYDNNAAMKKGGSVSVGTYLKGKTKGQDDKIHAKLSDGEYVIDASTVSDLGDGNSNAGASVLDKMVKNIRKHKRGNSKLPPKAREIHKYINT